MYIENYYSLIRSQHALRLQGFCLLPEVHSCARYFNERLDGVINTELHAVVEGDVELLSNFEYVFFFPYRKIQLFS